jgi:hypothetical protein
MTGDNNGPEVAGELAETVSMPVTRVAVHCYFGEAGQVSSIDVDINERGINARTVAAIVSALLRAAHDGGGGEAAEPVRAPEPRALMPTTASTTTASPPIWGEPPSPWRL